MAATTKECRSCREKIHRKATVCPHCRTRQGWTLGAKLGMGFLLLMFTCWGIGRSAREAAQATAPPRGNVSTVAATANRAPAPVVPRKPSAREMQKAALGAVKLDSKWWKDGFGNVMMANFTVSNSSPYAVKDIEVECIHFAPSGTRVDSNKRTIFEVVGAGKSRTVDNFNMGFIHSQAESSACRIVDLALADS